MAEDKKSFIAYADWESQFNLLSNEEAGKLIKHIFSYVNDRDPNFDDKDRILQLAFEPIKNQLKRDLKKYESKKKGKSENGIIGNLKRWHLDLYELLMKKEITLETAQNIASRRSKSLSDNSDRSLSQEVANIADTVNDTVTVNVNVTDTVNESVIGDSHSQKFSSIGKQPIETLKKICAGYSEWLNVIAKKNTLSHEKVLEWLDAFELHMLGKGINEETEKEFKTYFNSWITSEIRQGRTPQVQPPPEQKQKIDATSAMQNSLIKKYGHV